MEDPYNEIEFAVSQITAAAHHSPQQQRAAVEKYYSSECEFNHPLCTVLGAPSSRDSVLRVYQWYRIMSPKLDLRVDDRVWDEATGLLYLQVTQTFHIRISPFPPHPARLVVKLKLVKEGDMWFIKRHEDFYQPEDVLFLLVPPLAPIVRLIKRGAAAVCTVSAVAGQTLGFWRPEHDKDD